MADLDFLVFRMYYKKVCFATIKEWNSRQTSIKYMSEM